MTLDSIPKGCFGPNHELVMEVLQLVNSPGFLRRKGVAPMAVRLVASLNELKYAEPAHMERTGDAALTWDDVLEHRRGEYLGATAGMSEAASMVYYDRVGAELRTLHGELCSRFPDLPRDLRWLVEALVADCALSRCMCGRNSAFWETVIECLEAGIISVGWSGRWPEGYLIGYRPLPPENGAV